MGAASVIEYVPLKVVPLELKEANALVESLHRHHKKCQGHRFSIGVIRQDTGELVGAAIVGRPVARAVNSKEVLEVTRLVTNGTRNACSKLYGACARIGKELGYKKVQTYILKDDEQGISLKASGWTQVAFTAGGQWTHTDGKPRRTDQPITPKSRWEKVVNL
jgi:hypothetical protein